MHPCCRPKPILELVSEHCRPIPERTHQTIEQQPPCHAVVLVSPRWPAGCVRAWKTRSNAATTSLSRASKYRLCAAAARRRADPSSTVVLARRTPWLPALARATLGTLQEREPPGEVARRRRIRQRVDHLVTSSRVSSNLRG